MTLIRNQKTTKTTSFVPDPKNQVDIGENGEFRTDVTGNLLVRSAVFSDEGSFRYDFEGTSLVTAVTGIGITTVTGALDSDTTVVGASDLIIDLFFV